MPVRGHTGEGRTPAPEMTHKPGTPGIGNTHETGIGGMIGTEIMRENVRTIAKGNETTAEKSTDVAYENEALVLRTEERGNDGKGGNEGGDGKGRKKSREWSEGTGKRTHTGKGIVEGNHRLH